LPHLSLSDLDIILQQSLEIERIPPDFLKICAAETRGNPCLLSRYVATLLERQALTMTDGSLTLGERSATPDDSVEISNYLRPVCNSLVGMKREIVSLLA